MVCLIPNLSNIKIGIHVGICSILKKLLRLAWLVCVFSLWKKNDISKRHRLFFCCVSLSHTLMHGAEEPSRWVTPAVSRHRATGKAPARSCSGAQGMLTAGALGSDPGLLTQLWHGQCSQVPKPPEVQRRRRGGGGGRGVPAANLAGRVNRYKIKQSAGLTGCHRVSFVDRKMAVRQVSKTLLGKRSFL